MIFHFFVGYSTFGCVVYENDISKWTGGMKTFNIGFNWNF